MKFKSLHTAKVGEMAVTKGEIVSTDDKELIKLFESSTTMVKIEDAPKTAEKADEPKKKGGK